MEKMHIFNHVTNPTLEKTVDLMVSGDYTANFVAEYRQLVNRINALQKRVKGYKFNKKDSAESTAVAMLYLRQLRIMKDYQEVMKLRAEIEGIDLKSTKVIYENE